MCRSIYLIIIILSLSQACIAQDIDREAYRSTDSLVRALGPMDDSSLKSIVRSITPLCRDQACLVLAIYKWVTLNIANDCAGAGHSGRANNSASYVLATRAGTGAGYANLVAEMCRMAGITCEVVNGIAKREIADIGHIDNEDNAHSWNTVQAKGRWFVLDAAWGAGFCDGRRFVKEATDAWFLTNRKLFVLCHYPRDKRQQLLDTPAERAAFLSAPVIGPVASILGIFPMPGQRGVLRGRQDSSLQLSFTVRPAYLMERIGRAAVVADGDTMKIPFFKNGNVLSVTIPFSREGGYPLTLLINGGPAFGFRAEALQRLKRRDAKP